MNRFLAGVAVGLAAFGVVRLVLWLRNYDEQEFPWGPQ